MVAPWEVRYQYLFATYLWSKWRVRLLFLKNLYFIAVMLMTSTVAEKKFKHDELFEKLSNYHPKIKLTIGGSWKKFWTQVYILTMVSTTLKFIEKQQSNLDIGHQKFLKDTNVIWYLEIYINLIAYWRNKWNKLIILNDLLIVL